MFPQNIRNPHAFFNAHLLFLFIRSQKDYCKNLLFRLIENKKFVEAVPADLSEAFDCIPPKLLTAKMYVYSFSMCCCKCRYNIITFVCTTSYLFPSALLL